MPKIVRKIFREMVAVFFILAIALGIELVVFNYHSFVKGETTEILYQPGEALPDGIQEAEEMNHGVRLVLKDCTYIKKMQIQLDVPGMIEYTVYLRYDNEFGVEEVGNEKDTYWPELGCGFTNIDRNLKVLTLALPKGTPAFVRSIRLYTKTAVNKYRFLFLVISLFFLYILLFKRKIFQTHLDWVVAVSCLILGCFIIYAQGIQENGWDEQIHFRKIYQMSFGSGEIKTNDTFQKMVERLPANAYNTAEEKELFTQYLNDKYHSNEQMVENDVRMNYIYTGYIFQAIGIWLGRMLNLSFNRLFMLGKLVNLLTYVFFLFWSIRLMPRRKELIAALALVPTQVYIATTYTYDVTVNVLMIFGVVLWLKVILEEKNKKVYWYLMGSVLAFTVGSLSKAVYIPLIAVCYFVPKEKLINKKHYPILAGIVTICLVAVLMTFVIPSVVSTVTNQVGTTGDPRGGNTDEVLQLQSILMYPFQYVKIFVWKVVSEFGRYFAGNASLVFFGRIGELSSRWIYITIAWIFGVTFVSREGETLTLKKQYKLVLVGILAILLALIWTALYLSYTPVGADTINGVQPRYYYPLMLPMMLLCANGRCFIRIDEISYRKLVIAAPILLSLVEIYSGIFMV